jgi:Holliday junction resolvase RusA-like endonuclease
VTATIAFTIPGNPVPKGRPRFTRQGRTYTPAKTKTYEEQVAVLAKAACPEPFKTPVAVLVTAVFPVPLTYPKKRREACLNGLERHTKRPDLDNIVKAVTDGMNGVVYGDDSQIVRLVANKVYGTDAMVEVTVQEVLQ